MTSQTEILLTQGSHVSTQRISHMVLMQFQLTDRHTHTSSHLFFTHRPSGIHWTLNEENSIIDLPACVDVNEGPLSLFYHTCPLVFSCYQSSAESGKLY